MKKALLVAIAETTGASELAIGPAVGKSSQTIKAKAKRSEPSRKPDTAPSLRTPVEPIKRAKELPAKNKMTVRESPVHILLSYQHLSGFAKYTIARQVGNKLERMGSRVATCSGGLVKVHLLREVEKYLKRSEVAPAKFGREAMGDPRFVFDLRNGREPREATVRRVRTYLEARA